MERKVECAAVRKNFSSDIYHLGVSEIKQEILNSLPEKYSRLHTNGYIHIHDLEGYGTVYNCSMPTIMNLVVNSIQVEEDSRAILMLFAKFKEIITNIAVSQTGGIGFQDFESLVSKYLSLKKVRFSKENKRLVKNVLYEFVDWLNITKTRYCREPYYVTLNIGIDETKWGRFVCLSLLDIIYSNNSEYTRPNVVFKVKRGVNLGKNAPNNDLLIQALKCSAKRMIPTFLLLDSKPNKDFTPEQLGIMGCRTRVVANVNGDLGTLGRGNVANISINLPRIALENNNLDSFKMRLTNIMNNVNEILLDRVSKMRNLSKDYLNYIFDNKLWNDVIDIEELINKGTLSIGFIGLSETVEILSGKKIYKSQEAAQLGYGIVEYMRKYTDYLTSKYNLNYSLLASAGELISGRFCEIDKQIFNHPVQAKNFYTNSFHVEVDSQLSIFNKIDLEAPYHMLCNGGCITYIELKEAPLKNISGLYEIIEYSINAGLSYMAFNYPMDICESCGEVGTFDSCPKCSSKEIKRIRRVSGYLENLSHFTSGKIAEVNRRCQNE